MIAMNPPDRFAAGDGSSGNRPSPRKVELQGPRPTALKVNKDSYKIRKPPIHPNQHPQEGELLKERKPVIIYAVSPKVIHATVSDFMSIVQRLTGHNNSSAAGGDLSPAARLASIEKTSPCGNKAMDLLVTTSGGDHLVDGNEAYLFDDLLGRDYGNMASAGRSGILSPAPGSLLPPPVSPWFFSPDPFAVGGGNNFYVVSPSASAVCWSPALLSPSPTTASFDIFNPFFDF